MGIFIKRDFRIDKKLCFVLIPFEEQFKMIYEKIIKFTVSKVGLKCKRADHIYGTRAIMEDIWEYVNKARIIIADLTGKNPNVLYEIGLSHALHKEVILISQTMDDVPFDIRHLRVILYDRTKRGRKILQKGLESTLNFILSEEG